jgi:hypothetical protein
MNEKFVSPAIETIQGDLPDDKTVSYGAYKQDGEVFIFADAHDPAKLAGFNVKQGAYDHRLSIGLAHAGIGSFGTPFIVGPKDPKTGLEKQAGANKFIWRQLFKLTPML